MSRYRLFFERSLHFLIGLMCLIGIGSSLAPYLLSHELHMQAAAILYGDYSPQINRLARFTVADFIHRAFGALYFIIAPLQFVRRLRVRYPAWHRWSGRLFLLLSALAVASGLYFTMRAAFVGLASSIPISLVALYIAITGALAYRAARARRFAQHREWMLRCFAGGLMIATIRMYFLFFLYATSLSAELNLVTCFWLGPLTNYAVVELWIRYTRPAPAPRNAG